MSQLAIGIFIGMGIGLFPGALIGVFIARALKQK